jgi:hypothetical protein
VVVYNLFWPCFIKGLLLDGRTTERKEWLPRYTLTKASWLQINLGFGPELTLSLLYRLPPTTDNYKKYRAPAKMIDHHLRAPSSLRSVLFIADAGYCDDPQGLRLGTCIHG